MYLRLHGEQEWNTGPLHIAADLPAGIIQEVQAEIYHKSSEDEKIFMNGYQTWTVSPEYKRHSRIRGMHRIPKNLIDKYAFDRYADYHFVNYPISKGNHPWIQLVLVPAGRQISAVCFIE